MLEFALKNTPLYLKEYRKLNSESEYYSWEEKHVANFSVDLSDEFTIESKKNNSKLGIGWILDYRTLISDSSTRYSVNGTKSTYRQDNDLKKQTIQEPLKPV